MADSSGLADDTRSGAMGSCPLFAASAQIHGPAPTSHTTAVVGGQLTGSHARTPLSLPAFGALPSAEDAYLDSS